MSDGFGSKLRAGDFVISAEISPPLSSDPEDLLEKGHAAWRTGQCGQHHGWGERARPYERTGGRCHSCSRTAIGLRCATIR